MKTRLLITALAMFMAMGIKATAENRDVLTPLEKKLEVNKAITEIEQATKGFIDKMKVRPLSKDSIEYIFHYSSDRYTEKEALIEQELNKLLSIYDYWQGAATNSFNWDKKSGSLPFDKISIRYIDNKGRPQNRTIFRDGSGDGKIVTFIQDNIKLRCFRLTYKLNKVKNIFSFSLYISDIRGRVRNIYSENYYCFEKNLRNAKEFKVPEKYDYDFDELKAKLLRLNRAYNHENKNGKDAVLVNLNKISEGYTTNLTLEQTREIKNILSDFLKSANKGIHQSVISYAIAMFESKTDSTKKPTVKISRSVLGFSHIYTTVGNKYITYNSDAINDNEYAELKLSVKALKDTKKITLYRSIINRKEFVLDSSNKNLRIKENIPLDEIMSITSDNFDIVYFINDGKPVRIDLEQGRVYGSTLNEKFNRYERLLNSHRIKLRTTKTEAEKDSIYNLIYDIQKQAINDNLDNLISAFYLSRTFTLYDDNKLKWFISDEYPYANNPILSPVCQYLEHKKLRVPGKMYTDFVSLDREGNIFKLSHFAGRNNYVLLDFRSTVFEKAMLDTKVLNRLNKIYAPKGLYIATVWIENDREKWLEKIKKDSYDWFQICGGKDFNDEAARAYGITTLPSNVLIGPDGRIVACDIKNNELENFIDNVFKAHSLLSKKSKNQ